MNIEAFRNRKIAVLGFGIEGQAVLAFLLKHSLSAVVFDQKPFEEWDNTQQLLCTNGKVQTITGPTYLEELTGFDIAFRSPGIWRDSPQLLKAEENGLVVTSQVKVFFQNFPGLIIGVTGTKGKGTTSSLIYAVIKDALSSNNFSDSSPFKPDSKIFLTGNIGAIQPLDILENLTSDDVVVYELSSFQLQDLTQSPQYAVVLMVTQDHLDHHESLEEYHVAKQNIAAFQRPQDFKVVNIDYPASKKIVEVGSAQTAMVSKTERITTGCSISEQGEIFVHGFEVPENKAFIKLNEVLLRGFHNLENISASIPVALNLGIASESIQNSIKNFKGLEHRLEFVGTVNGISFYNDSFSTVPETSIAAINAFDEPLVLIVGGSEKNSDFTELGKTIAERKNIKSLIVIGDTAPKILEAVKATGDFSGQVYEHAKTIDEIFEQIKKTATIGDVVLLSPGCASFGIFANYKDRGLKFKNAVKTFGDKK